METLKRILGTKTVQVALWVAVSGIVTAVLSVLLQDPKLTAYYGIINVVLVSLKEVNDHR